MKLNIFNRWKSLGVVASRELEYQTSPAKGADNVYVTYVRDAKTGKVVTKGFGPTADASQKNTLALLKKIGPDGIFQAIETGVPVLAGKPEAPQKEIDWRDGSNHSYRAQKRIVGEGEEPTSKNRNFVAEHARMVNKAGPMKDKKNDYKRKPKHDKKPTDAE